MIRKKNLAAVLLICSFLLSGCGVRGEKEAYSSPNFSKQESSSEESSMKTSEDEALITDEDGELIDYSSLSDGELAEMPEMDETVDPSRMVGYYYDNDYYLPFAGFGVLTDGDNWRLYNAYQVSEVTDFTEEEVEAIWNGEKSPNYLETTVCAVAYHFQTGSNIVISYINPKMFWMTGLSAKDYLEMIAEESEGLTVQTTTYLGREYAVLDIPSDEDDSGRRVQFVTEKDGFLVSIVYTVQGDRTLEGMAEHLVRIQ